MRSSCGHDQQRNRLEEAHVLTPNEAKLSDRGWQKRREMQRKPTAILCSLERGLGAGVKCGMVGDLSVRLRTGKEQRHEKLGRRPREGESGCGHKTKAPVILGRAEHDTASRATLAQKGQAALNQSLPDASTPERRHDRNWT